MTGLLIHEPRRFSSPAQQGQGTRGLEAWFNLPLRPVYCPSMTGRVNVAALLLSACALARPVDQPRGPKPLPIPANGWDTTKQAQHLLNRAAFGPSNDDRARVLALSPGGWLAEQLAAGRDEKLEAQLDADSPLLKLSVTQARKQFPTLAERAKQLGIDKASVEDKQELKEMA